MAASAAEHATRSEQDRRLPRELVDQLADAGLFRLCVPAAVGGLEASPLVLVQAVEALAGGDASAAWCVAIGATSGLVGGYLPPDAAREIYGPPEAIVCGVFAPRGRAAETDAGFRVHGRWPFASGCDHADWLMGGTVVEQGDDVRRLPNGMPDVRLMLAPAAEVRIHDTWNVAGLRGTGSHDIEFGDVFIPAAHGASVFADRPIDAGPLYAFPLFGLLAVAIAGVSLGTGRAALRDLLDLAAAKRPTGSQRLLGERAVVQAEVARAEAQLRGARSLLHESVQDAWEIASDSGEVPVEQRMALRLAATHATTVAAEAALTAYRLGGGSAVYDRSPLQRRFRDANVATQHMLVASATWELTGRLLLGLPTDTTQL